MITSDYYTCGACGLELPRFVAGRPGCGDRYNYAIFGDMDTGRIVCLDCAAAIEAREREQARADRARRLERNQAARMRNAAIREICGTSARAARLDGGF